MHSSNVIVDSESQAQTMLILKDLGGKRITVSPAIQLVPFSYPMEYAQWASVGPTILLTSELIADKHDITHVSYFTFKGQNPPDSV